MTSGDWISIGVSAATLVVGAWVSYRYDAWKRWERRRQDIEQTRRTTPMPGGNTTRSLYTRQVVGPLWVSVLLDGSTVVARRFGLNHGTALRRGLDANLSMGAPTIRIVEFHRDPIDYFPDLKDTADE